MSATLCTYTRKDGNTGFLRAEVLHSEPDTVDWIGSVDEETQEVTNVIPVILTSDPREIGRILVRDLAYDLRKGRENPDWFTTSELVPNDHIEHDSPVELRAKALRAKMITRGLLGQTINKENRIKLLTILLHVVRANYPTIASLIEQDKLRVRYKGIPIFKATDHYNKFGVLHTVDQLVEFLGSAYVLISTNLVRHAPKQVGLKRFEAPVG